MHKVLILDLIHRIRKIHARTLICEGPSDGWRIWLLESDGKEKIICVGKFLYTSTSFPSILQ